MRHVTKRFKYEVVGGCTLSFSAFYHLQNNDEVGEVGNFLCAYLLFSSILRLLIFISFYSFNKTIGSASFNYHCQILFQFVQHSKNTFHFFCFSREESVKVFVV